MSVKLRWQIIAEIDKKEGQLMKLICSDDLGKSGKALRLACWLETLRDELEKEVIA